MSVVVTCERPVSVAMDRIELSRSMSRFEARLALELALEARFPRLIQKKPLHGGLPIGARLALPLPPLR